MSGVEETSEEVRDETRRREFVRMRLLAAGKLREKFTEWSDRDREDYTKEYPSTSGGPYPWVCSEAEGITMAFLDFVRRVDFLCQDSEQHAEQFGDTPSVYVSDLRNALYESLQIRTRESILAEWKDA